MAHFVILVNFTAEGMKNVKDTVTRAKAFKEAAAQAGCEVKAIYWTAGQYDLVTILSAPDASTAAALALKVGSAGFIHTQAMMAFDEAEMSAILTKMG
jgi:uncharacterized protein with GYD domain